MQQLELFSSEIEISDVLKNRIQHFKKLVEESAEEMELVAVNKMYESVAVYVPKNNMGEFQTAIERNGHISLEYKANDRDGLGTNFLILDEKYKGYESITVYKKSVLNGCNVKELNEWLADGWKVLSRSGVLYDEKVLV